MDRRDGTTPTSADIVAARYPLATNRSPLPNTGAGTVLAMLLAAALPAFLTLRTVVRPAILVQTSDNPTPYGYTWSLSLWIVPLLAIVLYLHSHPARATPRRAFWTTVALLVPLGVLLDVLLGNAFFTFPNAGATLQIFVWGYDLGAGAWVKNIPIEEFGFYFFGIAFALALYLWSDLAWFGRYALVEGRGRWDDDDPSRPILRPHWGAILIGLALIGLAVAYKKLLSADPCGFPGYFTFLVLAAFVPAAMFYASVRDYISWRAFSFSALTMFTLSLLWEATIAFPYQWWGYKPEMMLGAFIEAWNGLPLEEPFLWLLVSITTTIVFETIHLWQRRRAAAPQV